MASRILRPLSYGDLFDELFDLYKKNFLLYVGIAGVVYVPIYAIGYAMGGFWSSLTLLPILLLGYVVQAAATWAISRTYLGQEASIAEAYRVVGKRIVPFVGTMIVVGLIIGAGMLLCFVPGIIFSFWYAFIAEVYILEGKVGKEARQRSKSLAAGEYGRIFVVLLLVGLLTSVLSMVLTMPVAFVAGMATGADPAASGGPLGLLVGIVQGIAMALTGPLQGIAVVLLYYDIRVRKEGFDIELLASSMGSAPVATDTDEVKPV